MVPEIDLQSLHFLTNIRFIPGERTLFKNVHMLPPATTLTWERDTTTQQRYWQPPVELDSSIRRPEECAEQTRDLLKKAVNKQMVSDVPLGLYLSGGIDSSSIVAMASGGSNSKVQTYSLGFNEPTDELADSRLVAESFGTEHSETTIDFDALSVFPLRPQVPRLPARRNETPEGLALLLRRNGRQSGVSQN